MLQHDSVLQVFVGERKAKALIMCVVRLCECEIFCGNDGLAVRHAEVIALFTPAYSD